MANKLLLEFSQRHGFLLPPESGTTRGGELTRKVHDAIRDAGSRRKPHAPIRNMQDAMCVLHEHGLGGDHDIMHALQIGRRYFSVLKVRRRHAR